MVFSLRTLGALALGLSALSFSTPTRRTPTLAVSVSGTLTPHSKYKATDIITLSP
jgi:hypothetical protein